MIGINKKPFKKMEFKRKYVYITMNTGTVIKHPINQVEMTLDLRNPKLDRLPYESDSKAFADYHSNGGSDF